VGLPLALFFCFEMSQESIVHGLFGLWLGFYIAQALIGVYYSVILKRTEWKPLKQNIDASISGSFHRYALNNSEASRRAPLLEYQNS